MTSFPPVPKDLPEDIFDPEIADLAKERSNMNWSKLRIFYIVAGVGSFTHAENVLNLSQSAISRHISSLEASLNTPLFHRHARGLILTEQGELLFRTVKDVFAKLNWVEAQLSETRSSPGGSLVITVPHAFGSVFLAPRIGKFIEAYPEIKISLILNDRELDLAMHEADIALRMYPARQSDLVQRHLTDHKWHAYASDAYLKRFGTPQKTEELDRHRLILFGAVKSSFAVANWLAHIDNPAPLPRSPFLTVNSLQAEFHAMRSGIGIATLPEYMIPFVGQDTREERGYQRLLQNIKPPVTHMYFVYPEELRRSKRVDLFRDFLCAELEAFAKEG